MDNFRYFDAILQFIKIISIFSFHTSLVHADRTPFVEIPIPIKKGRIGKTEFYHSVPRLRTPTETHLPLKKERKIKRIRIKREEEEQERKRAGGSGTRKRKKSREPGGEKKRLWRKTEGVSVGVEEQLRSDRTCSRRLRAY